MSPVTAGEGSLPVWHGCVRDGGASIPHSTGLHRGRQIQRLNSKARHCRTAGIRKGRKGRKERIVRLQRREPSGAQGSRWSRNSGRWVASGLFCTAPYEKSWPGLSREICFESRFVSSHAQAHEPTATVYLSALLMENGSAISRVLLGSTPAHEADS